MAAVSSLGSGSGLDLSSLVDKLIAAEGEPATARLDRTEARIQTKLTAYGSLKGGLSAFQSSIVSLTQLDTFQTKSVSTSSATETFTVLASSSAIPGTYNVEVTNLAQSNSLATATGQFTDITDAVGTGTLTISFGTVSITGDDVTGFDQNAIKPSINITVDASNNSLQGVRDAINDSNAGVSASIVDNGTDLQLVITSTETGKVNGMQISVDEGTGTAADNIDLTGLSRLAFNTSVTNLDNTVSADDASAIINGISVTSASNTINGAIEGVTLNLLQKSDAGVSVGVTVANNTADTKSAIEDFVTSFNTLAVSLASLTDVDVGAGTAGILTGDASVRGIENQIRRFINSTVPGLTGSIQSIVDLGITTSSEGNLQIDNVKLQAAIDNNFNDITSFFANIGGPTDSLVKYVSSTDDTKVSDFAVNITRTATQGTSAAGAAITDLNIGSANDELTIKVDGVQSATISLTNKLYASNSDLAAEIQSQINADAALIASGKSVTVSLSGSNALVITSNAFGSASAIDLTYIENATASGLTAGAGNDGVDVAGTIGGLTATGNGQFLTGKGDAQGLKLQILGTSDGSRGSVNFTNGLASNLDDLIATFLGSDGIIDTRTKGFKTSVDDINEKREALSFRLARLETRLVARFGALDILVTQLQQTSNFLTQQLESLPTVGANRK